MPGPLRRFVRDGSRMTASLLLALVLIPSVFVITAPAGLGAPALEPALVESTAVAKGLTLRMNLDPGPLVVPGDATEIDQVIGNLTSNAVKYTPSGGTVSVTGARRGDTVVLEVSDDGLGISEEDQVGLFRAFFRTTNPDALRETGTGLGLSIVDNIAGRHGGSVTVSSRLHEGTTFTVDLPRTATELVE